MTEQGALNLQTELENLFSTVLEETVELATTLAGELAITYQEFSILVHKRTFKNLGVKTSYDYIHYKTLNNLVKKTKKLLKANRDDLELLIWSQENRSQLTK